MLHVNLHEAQVRDAAREQTGCLKMIAKFRLEGTLQVPSPTSCSMQGQRWGQTRSLRTLSSWVLKTSEDRDRAACSAAGLSSRGTVICRIQSCIPSQPLLFQFMPVVTSLPTLHYQEEPAWLHLLSYPSQGRYCEAAVRSTWSCPFSWGKPPWWLSALLNWPFLIQGAQNDTTLDVV